MRRALGLLLIAALLASAWHWRGDAPATQRLATGATAASVAAGPEDQRAPDAAMSLSTTTAASEAQPESASPATGPAAPSPPASADSDDSSKRASVEPPALTLSPAQARERMRERRRAEDCQLATAAVSTERLRELERREWRWLAPEQVAAEQVALRAAVARVRARCASVQAGASIKEREQELAAAAAAGDLEARLLSWQRTHPRPDGAQTQSLFYDILLSGDLELIARIGQHWYGLRGSQGPPTEDDLISQGDLWQLVACDLGADCGRSSRVLDRLCFTRSPSACLAADVESALQPLLPDWQMRLIQARRAAMVARIRAGRIPGLLDPRSGG